MSIYCKSMSNANQKNTVFFGRRQRYQEVLFLVLQVGKFSHVSSFRGKRPKTEVLHPSRIFVPPHGITDKNIIHHPSSIIHPSSSSSSSSSSSPSPPAKKLSWMMDENFPNVLPLSESIIDSESKHIFQICIEYLQTKETTISSNCSFSSPWS